MEESGKKKQGTKNVTKLKTFPVPFSLGEIKEKISISTNAANQVSKEQIIKEAFKFHSQGNISEATKYYEHFINQGFNDHRVFSNYGIILNDIGKLQEAEKFTRKAIQLKPDLAEANSNLGSILRVLGKSKEAEKFTRKAIELKPDFVMAYFNLGNILKDIGKLQEAEKFTRKAIELKPDLAEANSNLGNILRDLGKLEEAENFYKKAIQLDPNNENIRNNLISLLTRYKPKNISSNRLYIINERFRGIHLRSQDNNLINDNEAIKIYRDGLEIYRKYNLDLKAPFSQLYKRNHINLNCKRHKLIFNKHKVIPEFCFGCYKVQIEVDSIIELIKLFIVFNSLNLKNNNTRKCMIELRPKISGFYKGLIYCFGLNEALEISNKVNSQIQNNIKVNLISKVKRGCSEYSLEFPQYKEIRRSGDQPMNYNQKWKSIENEIDKGNEDWGKQSKSIEGLNLYGFLIMRNWISYAQKIGDQNVSKITNEQIKGPKIFNSLKRDFQSKQTTNVQFKSSLEAK